MKSRWVINILLFVAIGILALVARYEPGIEEQPKAPPITSLKRGQVDSIKIERPLRDELILVKDSANTWSIERQPSLPAETFQINGLTKLAEQTAVRSYPAAQLDLTRLALDPPYATVTLNDIRIDFGSLEPLEGLRYVRVADQVHLISDMYQHLIEADFSQFVRRQLLAPQSSISGLALPGLSLAKSDGNWSSEPPREMSADAVQQLLTNWQSAAALRIQTAEPEINGERLVVSLENPRQEITFVISARQPELVLVRPDLGIQYRMGDLTDSLLALPEPATEAPQ